MTFLKLYQQRLTASDKKISKKNIFQARFYKVSYLKGQEYSI